MEYLDVAASFEELRTKADGLAADGTKSLIQYSDYGTAVFGFKVASTADLRAAPVIDNSAAALPGRADAIRERVRLIKSVLDSAPVLAWMKFGKPLSVTFETPQSFEEMVSMTRSNPSYFSFRIDGALPALADYSKAELGLSRIISVPKPMLSSVAPRLLGSTAGLWPNDDWWVVLGLVQNAMSAKSDLIRSLDDSRRRMMP